MTPSRVLRAFGLGCIIAAFAAILSAQEFRATLTGRVTDPSDNGISGAKVTAKNTATNETQTAVTGPVGEYTIPLLKPGTYNITAEAQGFKTGIREGVTLFVGSTATVNMGLEIGDVQQSVTITGEAPMLEADTATRGNVVENLRVTELPLNGRNPVMLAQLSSGVQYNGNPQFFRPFDNGDNVRFSINGGLQQANEYLLDGVPDDSMTDLNTPASTRSQQNIAYIPTVDATQEFKIVTNFYDSQYGRTGGGVINITTKSGSNDFHGTAYEFLRRYQMEANDIANNAAGRPRFARDPVTGANLGGHKQDQWGTDMTGPVHIPHVYNGKDKTFWHFGFENYKETSPGPVLTTVPTAAMRTGDFSKSGTNIYNPFTTRPNPSGSGFIRDQFGNNIIPQNLIDPVGKAIINAYPAPNVGGPDQLVNNFLNSPNLGTDDFRQYLGRVDQNFGQKERMFFRYAHNRRDQFQNGNGYPPPGKDAQDPLVRLNDTAVVDSVTVLSPATILDLRGGYTRFIQAAYRQSVMPFDATQLGFPASFSAVRPTSIPPRIDVAGSNTWGSRNPSQNTTNLLSFMGSLSHIRGRHSLKGGVDLRDYRINGRGGSFLYGGGFFQFNQGFTQQNPQQGASGSGNPFASLLLGTPFNGYIESNPQLAYNWGYYAFYVQDDIKVTARLTVNLGLCYDFEGAPTERYNQMNRGFAFNQPSPLASNATVRNANTADCPACASLTGGLLFVGTQGQPRAAFNNDYNNWQPRVGAAYQLTTRTVMRGGYGIFYLPEAAYGGSSGYSIRTPFVSSVGGNEQQFIPATLLSNPFPSGLLQPTGNSQGLGTFTGLDFQFQNPNRKIPYVHQFSFGIQHQLPWNTLLDAAYVGSRSIGVNTGDNLAGDPRNINDNTPDQYARARQNPTYFTQAVPNPFAGLIPNNPALNGPTIARQQLLKPYPQFGTVTEGMQPVGKIWYDSLQANLTKRFTQGLVFVGSYTWAKNLEALSFLNPYDPSPTKVFSPQDRTHRLVLSGVAEIPYGRGRHWGSNAGAVTNLILGGWEYTWNAIWETGTPMSLPSNVDIIGNLANPSQSYNQWFNGCVQQANGTTRQPNAAHNGFESCSNPVWAVRQNFSLRTIPFRTGAIRNPWAFQADMSLNKRFRFTERYNAQFRFETFNVFNTPIRPEPNNDPTSAGFGLVPLGERNYPRQVQLGFKFNW